MNSGDIIDELLQNGSANLVVAMAVTEWSAGAMIMGDQLDEFVKKQRNVLVRRFDVEENPEFLQYFRIGKVPTIIVLKNKEVVDVVSGMINKRQLFQRLGRHL